jgi:hypothetical protein
MCFKESLSNYRRLGEALILNVAIVTVIFEMKKPICSFFSYCENGIPEANTCL